jgi:hypothetical protein
LSFLSIPENLQEVVIQLHPEGPAQPEGIVPLSHRLAFKLKILTDVIGVALKNSPVQDEEFDRLLSLEIAEPAIAPGVQRDGQDRRINDALVQETV